jgi:hypothetical protein
MGGGGSGKDADSSDDDDSESVQSQTDIAAIWDEVDARIVAFFGKAKGRDFLSDDGGGASGGGDLPEAAAADAAAGAAVRRPVAVRPKVRREALELVSELEQWRTLSGPCGEAAANHLREIECTKFEPLRLMLGFAPNPNDGRGAELGLHNLSPHTTSQVRFTF